MQIGLRLRLADEFVEPLRTQRAVRGLPGHAVGLVMRSAGSAIPNCLADSGSQIVLRKASERLAGRPDRYNLRGMSRAFTKEADEAVVDELPERPVSTAPNFVTREGHAAIEAEVARLTAALAEAGEDRAERARIGRDLRYWTARRGNAHIVDRRRPIAASCASAAP